MRTQEAVRRDLECLFEFLQGRFKILRHEVHGRSDEQVILVSHVCVILHNMIIQIKKSGELEKEVDADSHAVDIVS